MCAPIDRKHLAAYTLGDPQLEAEILSLFLDQLPDIQLQLEGLKTSAEWRDIAHKLKGSARAVGAIDVARLAEEAESSADPADRAILLERLDVAFRAVNHYVDTEMKRAVPV